MKKIIKAAAGTAMVWAGLSYTAVKLSYKKTFGRSSLSRYSTDLRYRDYVEMYPGRYPRRRIEIPDNGYSLTGYLYGEDKGKGLIIFSHGIFAGHENYIGGLLSLVDRGYMVLGFDNTGCCESPGAGIKGLPQGPLDLNCAIRYVKEDKELSGLPLFLYGHSWGGYSVTAVLNFTHKVDGVVSVSGFDTPLEVTADMGEAMFGRVAELTKPMLILENRKTFKENANLSAVEGINSCTVPVMIMHGTGDDYVSYKHAGIIHHREEITNPNAVFVPLDYPGRNGHNDIFLSEGAKNYLNELEKKIKPIKKKYKVKESWDLPEEVQAEFFKDVDRKRASEGNMDLLDKIDGFFSEILAGMSRE